MFFTSFEIVFLRVRSAAIAVAAVASLLILSGALAAQQSKPDEHAHHAGMPARETDAELVKDRAPVLDGLGEWTHPVGTKNERAQLFFDQGLKLIYGFNHDEAARAFREVARLDPDCAMAYWGLAFALGPNINDPMLAEREQNAFEAVRKAVARLPNAPHADRLLIEALAVRYAEPFGQDRAERDRRYVDAMREVHRTLPDDADVATLYADAIMNTMPWNYWRRDGSPKPGTQDVIDVLEATIRGFPRHIGAHHLYIHITEASSNPDRALVSAAMLPKLAPNAGHLVHMPAHVYIRTGRYFEAAIANDEALLADHAYITQCRSQGIYPLSYHPHNHHFLWAATTMMGSKQRAIEAAYDLDKHTHQELMRERDWATLQFFHATPMFALVRFGEFDRILAFPKPGSELRFALASWHYAQGVARSAKGEFDVASGHLAELRRIAAEEDLKNWKVMGLNSFHDLLAIASETLEGEMLSRSGRHDEAIAHLSRAVRLEDSLLYDEPPDWHYPVRHSLGAALLAAGRPAEAEVVYWDDLGKHRENGWGLFGLWQSLQAQGRHDDAKAIRARFERAWKHADITLAASRF